MRSIFNKDRILFQSLIPIFILIELNFTELAPNTKYKMYLHIQCDGTYIAVFIVVCDQYCIYFSVLLFSRKLIFEIVLNQYKYWC